MKTTLQTVLVVIAGIILWDFLAIILMPDIHARIDPYIQESRKFEEDHGVSRVDYMKQLRYDTDRIMEELGIRPEPFSSPDDENESSTASGK